eukprot:5633135-Pyramimonas_sp.AAC.1
MMFWPTLASTFRKNFEHLESIEAGVFSRVCPWNLEGDTRSIFRQRACRADAVFTYFSSGCSETFLGTN